MIRDFFIKQGDELPSFAATLLEEDGQPAQLAGASVVFSLRNTETGLRRGGSAIITDETAGKVRYDWQAGDTDAAGIYVADWRVIYGSGKQSTYPSHRYLLIEVLEQV